MNYQGIDMKLSLICETIVKPVVTNVMFNPASVRVRFPNAELWEYRIYDNIILNNLIRKYNKNVGKFVSELKKFKSIKIEPKDIQ